MAEVNSPLGMDDEEFLKQDLSELEAGLIAAEEAEAQENTEEIDTKTHWLRIYSLVSASFHVLKLHSLDPSIILYLF